MTEQSVVIACRLCGHQLRVRADRGVQKIRCPSCHNESAWTPTAPGQVESTNPLYSKTKVRESEVQKVSFFCAENGAEFSVVFGRKSQKEKFRIHAIQGSKSKRFTYSPSNLKKIMEWMGTVLGLLTSGESLSQAKSFDAKDFDFAGWRCACCNHKTWPQFVRCSKCNRLVCGSKVISTRIPRLNH